MGSQILDGIVPGFLALLLVMPVYGVVVYRRRVRAGTLTRVRAVVYCVMTVLAPVAVYILLLLALVGLEELTGLALVTEGFARGAVPLVGAGLVVALLTGAAFACYLAFAGRSGA